MNVYRINLIKEQELYEAISFTTKEILRMSGNPYLEGFDASIYNEEVLIERIFQQFKERNQ